MKNYYQYKNDFCLPKPIYRKTVKTVQCYDFYKSIANTYSVNSTCGTEKLTVNRMQAQHYVTAVDEALKNYVVEEYREAVFAHLLHRKKYADLEFEYGISTSTMKRWVQKFVYGVATYLGDNFRD
jgi:hypothetical protein